MACATSASAAILLSEYDDTLTNLVSGAPNGTASGGVSMIPGKIGDFALGFDGTSGYVNTTTAGFPNSSAGLWTGTASFWIRDASLNPTVQEVILGGTNAGTNLNFQITTGKDLANANRSLKFYLRSNGGTGIMDFGTTDTSWVDGDWHHIAMTWNATTGNSGTGTAAIYIDGVAATGIFPGGTTNTITSLSTFSAWGNPVRIGAGTRDTTSSYLSSDLDDFSVWNGQLSATEALAIYNLGDDTVLNYNVTDANTLFGIFAAQGTGATSDGNTWQYVTGLAGTAGSLLNSNTLILDGAGNGVQIVPEPASLVLMGMGWGCVLLARRRRVRR